MEYLTNPFVACLALTLTGVLLFEGMRLAIPHMSASMSAPAVFGVAMSSLDYAKTIDWSMFAGRPMAYAIGLAIVAIIWHMRTRTKNIMGLDR